MKKMTKVIGVTVDIWQYEKLKEYCNEHGLSIPAFIRKLIDKFFYYQYKKKKADTYEEINFF